MPIRVQLENRELRLDVDPDAWKRAFQRAMENNGAIEVKNARGEVLSINPRQVQYWTPLDQEPVLDQAVAVQH